ncbi:MAG: single-stranded DNA-binding protein [Planctomycetes bacterium]|nr:single-stranded DNA-binding protein [Planctomycetota bacterium]
MTVAGNLTRNPDVKMLANDRSVANFSIAVNRRYKTADGESKEEATFLDCEAWGRIAELIGQYLIKGSNCYVEGRLKLDQWDDKDGRKRSRVKIMVENVQFIGRPKSADAGGEAVAASAPGPMHTAPPVRASAKPAPRTRETANAYALPVGEDQPPF